MACSGLTFFMLSQTSKPFKEDSDISHASYLFNCKIQHASVFSFPGLLRLSWALRILCPPRASMRNHRGRDSFGTAACNRSKQDEVQSRAEEQGHGTAGGYGHALQREMGSEAAMDHRAAECTASRQVSLSPVCAARSREEHAGWWLTLPSYEHWPPSMTEGTNAVVEIPGSMGEHIKMKHSDSLLSQKYLPLLSMSVTSRPLWWGLFFHWLS